MPTYTFKNLTTGDIEEHKVSISEYDQFKIDNPNLERYMTTESLPGFGDGMRMDTPGVGKSDSGFEKYVIGRMKETIPGNRLGISHKHKIPREW